MKECIISRDPTVQTRHGSWTAPGVDWSSVQSLNVHTVFYKLQIQNPSLLLCLCFNAFEAFVCPKLGTSGIPSRVPPTAAWCPVTSEGIGQSGPSHSLVLRVMDSYR